MAANLRLLPHAALRFPAFLLAWALLALGGVAWCALELLGEEGEE